MSRNPFVNQQYRDRRTVELKRWCKDMGFEVQQLTEYQYRIEGVMDLYPTNGRWHYLPTNQRGYYNRMENIRKLLIDLLPKGKS